MKLTLTNKTVYDLSKTEAEQVLEAIQSDERYAIVQGDYIMLNAIIAIQDDARVEESDHIRNGDYKCAHGEWHMRNDQCYGHDPKISQYAEIDPSFRLKDDNRDEPTKYAAARAAADRIRTTMNW